MLRFYAFAKEQGTVTYYIVCYFLADDTFQVDEHHDSLVKSHGMTTLLKRSQLRKNPCVTAIPGMLEPDPVLYTPADLGCGKMINLLNSIMPGLIIYK